MNARVVSMLASACLLALIVLCVAWELWLAPLRPGGSWLVLKALPLLGAVFGVLRGRRYTYQWLSMAILLYLTEGVLRIGDGGGVGPLAAGEVALSVVLFACCLVYARITAPSRAARSSSGSA